MSCLNKERLLYQYAVITQLQKQHEWEHFSSDTQGLCSYAKKRYSWKQITIWRHAHLLLQLHLYDPSCEGGIKLSKRPTSQRSKCFIIFSCKLKSHVLISNIFCKMKDLELARELRSTTIGFGVFLKPALTIHKKECITKVRTQVKG